MTSDLPRARRPGGHADTNDDIAQREARAHGVAILPMVQNYDADTDDFRLRLAARSAVQPRQARRRHRRSCSKFVTQGDYQGVNIDFETDQDDDQAGMTAFMTELAAAFHPRGLLVTQDIQLDSDAYDLPTLARVDDFLVPMLYDQHADGDHAGPIAGQDWFADGTARSSWRRCPATKSCSAWATTATTGPTARPTPHDMSFEEAAQIAQEIRATARTASSRSTRPA